MNINEEFQCFDGVSVSPLTIRIMLVCYSHVTPKDAIPEWNSTAATEIMIWLQTSGLVDADFRATLRGKAWANYICATPLPVCAWTLPARPHIDFPVDGQ